MKKLKLFFACLLMAVLSIGQMWAAEELKATLDFTDSGWGIPTSGTNKSTASFTRDGITIKLTASTNYKQNSGYLILGKANSTLELPAFTWKTTRIEVDGHSGASGSVVQNIYVGENAVSTATTGANAVTNSYAIASAYQAAGNVYVFTVTSAHNTQIDKIRIYGEKAATTTPTIEADPASVDFGTKNIYDVANRTGSIDVAVSGSNLTGNITAALSGDDASKFSISGAPFAPEAGAASGTLTVSYEVTEAGVYEASLTLSSEGAENVVLPITLTATNVAPTLYDRVESDAALSAGNKIIIVNEEYKKAAGAISGTLLSIVDITDALDVTNGKLSITEEAVQVFTLGGAAGAWTLTSEAGQLSSVEAKKMLADGETTWAITIADGNAAPVSSTAAAGTLQYNDNSGSGRFTTYTSTQKPVQFYVESDGKASAGLAYDAADAQNLVKVGTSFTAPTLSAAPGFDGTVTFESDNTDVATVNATTGGVTIVGVGKAVISVSSEATANFKAGSASYTIFVAEQAGTNEDPLTEASAKALIDLGCEMEVHVHGTVLGSQDATKFTVTLAGGMQFYKLKDLGNVAFESAYIKNGDEVTAIGTLTKYNTTYELAEGCYLTAYTEYTEPLVDISNTKETAYTVAQALALATNPTSDLTKAVYITGVVYDVKSFNSTNGTLDIYIKDEGVENKFEFYKCAGIYDESLTAFTAADDVQVGDEVIGYGVMKYFSGGSIWEFDNTATGDYLVELTRPEVAVTSVSLPATETVEVGSTVTLTATVLPENATNKEINWSVTSGSDKASVADGVVTGLVAGEAVIRATSVADGTKYAECTVTVVAADPTKHVVTFDATVDMGESPLSKSNISMDCSNGVLNNGSEYRLYKSSTTTFACSAGNITKIEFAGVSGNPVSGFGDPEVGTLVTDGNNGVWTGNAASVSFVASGAQVRATEITVTYKEDNRAESGLAWSTDAVELTVGDAFTAPTLSNPNSISASAITIASNNPDLAVVNDGVVSLVAEATGEATITATFAGNDDYKPATVSYTITVNAASPVLTDYYEKVTETAGIVEGTYLLVYEEGSLAFNGGLTTLDAESNTIAVDITADSKIGVTEQTAAATFYIDPAAGTVKSASNYYIGVSSWSNGLKQNDTYVHNVLEIDGDGNAQVGIYNADWNTTGGTMRLQYNKSAGQTRFRYYKNGGQQSIALYKLHNEVIKPEAGLAWDPSDDIELTVGDAFTAPTLSNPNSIDAAEITIESSNPAVATVTAGVVALVADATGTTTITATFAGNASYKPATVSYKIKVNPANSIYVSPSLNINFGSVAKDATVDDKVITVTLTGVDAATATLEGTGASAFNFTPAALTASGDITISASSATAGTFNATLTISDDAGVAASKEVSLKLIVSDPAAEETPISTSTQWVAATEIADGMQVIITGVKDEVVYAMGEQKSTNRAAYVATLNEGVLTPGEGTMAFTLVAQGDGTYAIRTSNGKYLFAANSGANHLKTQDDVDENAKWTVTVASAVAEGSSNRNVMQFNGGSTKLFSCYATASQSAIQLYVPKPVTPPAPTYETVRTGLVEGRHYTVCLENNVTAVKGATFWSLTFKNNEGTVAYLVKEEAPFAAGIPYIFQATGDNEGKLEVVYGEEVAGSAGTNGALVGTFSYLNAEALNTINETDENEVYMLFENELRPIGTDNHLDAHRAYVLYNLLTPASPSSFAPGKTVKGMPMHRDAAQGFENLQSGDAPVKVMIEGTLYILRGEKVYDATGRLVK